MSNEISEISARYLRRHSIPASRYSQLNPVVNLMLQERQTALLRLFSLIRLHSISELKVLEVGCGTGSNLLELIQLGATPENLVGNDLLDERLIAARNRLPASVQLFGGDASKLELKEGSFDIVYQSTVFSSILDDALQKSLADKIWSLVKPGGGVVWYDFTFNNPANSDVRGVTVSRVKELFPHSKVICQRVTLAPPIARCVVPWSRHLYGVLNSLPFLRTHILCYLEKI